MSFFGYREVKKYVLFLGNNVMCESLFWDINYVIGLFI